MLTYAAFHGATKVVKHLLADGEFEPNFDPRFAGKAKRSAYNTLHAACAGGQIELVNYLLENHSDLLNIDMPDELLGQSPLQIAMLHNRLPLVMDITKNRLPNLKHVDFRGRTLLCTVLGTFMREGIKEDIVDKDRLPELENLCLDLLEMENAFKKSTSESVSAITLIFKSDLMSNASEDDKVNYPTPFVALFKIAKLCPRVAEKLNKQAIKLRDEGVLPATEEGGRVLAFISLYKEVMDQVAIESKPQLTAHLIEAAKR